MKKQVWVIANSFVMEPSLGGKLLGELSRGYKIADDIEIIPYTQKQFDTLLEEFHKLNGYYPDQ
jgi:hypothetical protein